MTTTNEGNNVMKAQELKEGMRIRCMRNGEQVFSGALEITEVVIVNDEEDIDNSFVEIEGYTDSYGKELIFASFSFDEEIELFESPKKTGTFYDFLPEGNFTEEDLWDAIAEQHGLDPSEIMDGDLAEWL
jgi:hypothetical protein